MRKSGPGLALAFLFFSSCGPSPEEVLGGFRQSYRDKREQLRRVASLLPPPGSFEPLAATVLDPPLVYESDGSSNADAIMFEQLTDPEARLPLDLFLSHSLVTALQWTAQESNPFAGGDPKFMKRILESGLAIRYLIVHRMAELELPRAIDENTYQAGHVTVEGYVVDLESESIAASYRVTADVPDSVEYSYRSDQSREAQLEEFARSAIWSACRDRIAEELRRVTGGTVRFGR